MVVDPRGGFRPEAGVVDLVDQVVDEVVAQAAHLGPGFFPVVDAVRGTVPTPGLADTDPQALQAQPRGRDGAGVGLAIGEESLDPSERVEQS